MYLLSISVNRVLIEEVKELKLSRRVLKTRNAMWEYATNTISIVNMNDTNGLAM